MKIYTKHACLAHFTDKATNDKNAKNNLAGYAESRYNVNKLFEHSTLTIENGLFAVVIPL